VDQVIFDQGFLPLALDMPVSNGKAAVEGQRQMEEKDNCQMGAGRCGNVEQPAK